MYTVRQLIHSAYKISSVCAIGQTPTAPEVDEALEITNGILDNFGMENLFKPGIIGRTVTSKSDGTIVIANAHTVTALTVPANVTLKFERDGSITNSGQLTINTKNIIADDHQIFTGTGDIDFESILENLGNASFMINATIAISIGINTTNIIASS